MRPGQRPPTIATRQITVGLTLNYVVQGDPAGRPVVLLHGAGDSWHSFELVLPHLPAKYRVYAVTLRGHGWSDHPAKGFASKDFASDIEAFLEQLQLTNVVLVGHSLGSFVAQHVAAESSGRVTKLVLIGSGPGSVRDPQTRDAIMAEFGQLSDPIPYTFARNFQASTIHGPVPASFFETMVNEALKAPASTWHGIARGSSKRTTRRCSKRFTFPRCCFGATATRFSQGRTRTN